jgi:hypothetical protein
MRLALSAGDVIRLANFEIPPTSLLLPIFPPLLGQPFTMREKRVLSVQSHVVAGYVGEFTCLQHRTDESSR